jgi:DNA-directed RNA polymerase subunit F
MTEKDIVRLAEEAELWLHTDRKYEAVEKFAKLVAAAEREAVAEMIEEEDEYGYKDLAKRIRARGQE